MMNKNIQENKEPVFAPKGGKPGYVVNGKWYPVDKQDLNTPQLKAEMERYARARGKAQLEKDQASLSKPKPAPTMTDAEFDKKYGVNEPPGDEFAGARQNTRPTTQPKPEATRPAPTTTPAAPRPAPAAPKPSPVADYMKAAAAARKSGDPAEMAKVRDMGMEIWRKSNPKLAAAADERARTRGTSATTNPLMGDMKSRLPAPKTPVPTPTPKVSVSSNKEMNKSADTLSKTPIQTKPNTYGTTMGAGPTFRGGPVPPPIKDNKNTRKEAYDVVLDYLLSEGHADTLSEAHYVMMQMDAEHIQNIIEAQGEWFGGLRDKARASREAQMRSAQPTPKPGPNVSSPFAKPASRDDSGKLTTYGAGGGAAAEREGKSRAEVMRQGAKNLENKKPKNQGPDFGR